MATALALETREGDKVVDQAIMVSCDLVLISSDVLDQTRRRVKTQLPGFDVTKLVLNATHIHSAPETLEGYHPEPPQGVMRPSAYAAFLVKRLSGVVVEAWNHRRPGAVSWGLGHAVVAQCRRCVYAGGKARTLSDTSGPDFRRIEGYEDHGVQVLFFWDGKKKLQAVAVNVACPAQEAVRHPGINADFWHPVREQLRERYGAKLCVLTWCGAAGDQCPNLMYRKAAEERMRQFRGLSRLDELARRIVAAVDEAYEGASKDLHADVPFQHLVQTVRLPMRKVTDEELQAAKDVAAHAASANGLQFWQSGVIRRYEQQKANPWYDVELHAIRLGDVAIGTNPFELFTDYGIQIQARSRAIQTFVIQLANGYGLYVPTKEAVRHGDFSTQIYLNILGPEGGQMLVDHTVELINSMWPKPNKSAQ